MEATTTLAISEIISLTQGLANTNLGYLGISVGIIALLGGAFYLFNVKPFSDKLEKQEEELRDLKREVEDSFANAEESLKNSLKLFKQEYSKELISIIEQKEKILKSNFVTKLAYLEKDLLNRIDVTTSENDEKLKEFVLSEMNNKILKLEKSLSSNINSYKTVNDKEVESLKTKTEVRLRELGITVRELETFKYDAEGKMGGIIGLLDTLEEYVKYRPYLLELKLEYVKEKIGKYTLSPELSLRLQNILNDIKGKEISGKNHDVIIAEIEALAKVVE